MPSNSAEYMRQYRQRRKGVMHITQQGADQLDDQLARLKEDRSYLISLQEANEQLQAENDGLRQEVLRLKQALAQRPLINVPTVPLGPVTNTTTAAPRDVSVSFRPVPKPSSRKKQGAARSG